ncbi:MFS transporter [Methylobacterium oryzisoli]
MPLVLSCYYCMYVNRVSLIFARPSVQSHLGFSDFDYSIAVIIYILAYASFEVPSNLLLYKVGVRRWSGSVLALGLANMATTFCTSKWQFYEICALSGALQAGFAPGIIYYLALCFPRHCIGRIYAVLFIAPMLAVMSGGAISENIILKLHSVLGYTGWQWLFIINSAPCFLIGFLMMIVLKPEIDEPHPAINVEGVDSGRPFARRTEPWPLEDSPFGSQTAYVFTFGFVYFIIQASLYSLKYWRQDLSTPVNGFGNGTSTLLEVTLGLIGSASMLLTGWLSDRRVGSVRIISVIICLAAAGYFAAAAFHNHLTSILLLLTESALLSVLPVFWALPPKILAGAALATGVAVINTIGQLGGVFSGLMILYLQSMEATTMIELCALGLLCLVCVPLMSFISPALKGR